MTLVTTKTTAVKIIKSDGSVVVPSPFLQASLERINPSTAQSFAAQLKSLTSNQTLIYGDTELTKLDKDNRRTKQNFQQVNNPWIGFDGDYEIQSNRLNIKHLANIDPQLAHTGYVIHNSSSNLIVDNKLTNPDRLKIWMQFNTQSQDDIREYKDRLMKRATLQGYAEYLLSPNPNTYQLHLKFIFDHSVFSPERVWYEGTPIIQAPNTTHNTQTTYREGPPIDLSLLPPLTDYEESAYQSIVQQLKRDKYQEQQSKRKQVLENYPELQRQYQEAEQHMITTHLTTSHREEVPVHKIINAAVAQDNEAINNFRLLQFRDPLDLEYGDNKAKLFFNQGSVYLHSFAHGSQAYRVARSVIELGSLMPSQIPAKPPRGTTLTSKQRLDALSLLKKLSPYYVIQDHLDLGFVSEEFKHISSASNIKKLLTTMCPTQSGELLTQANPMAGYYLYAVKNAPVIQYDTEEGLQITALSAMESIMANRIPNITGEEIVGSFLVDPARRECNGYGLYPHDRRGKLNLWTGFNAVQLKQTPTQDDIPLFIELTRLFARTDDENHYLMSYLADMIQAPLRRGPRSAIAIKGGKRLGKSFFLTLVGSFFHKTNRYRTSSADKIVGRFNSHLASTVCLLCDELNFQNSSMRGAKDALKSLITDEEQSIEMKGVDSTMAPNHTHLMLSTNHAQAVLQDADDVRWTIYEISTGRREDKVWFRSVADWWHSGGKDMVFTYLLNYEYDKSLPMSGYITETQSIEKASDFYNVEDFVFYTLLFMDPKAKVIISPSELHLRYCSYVEDKGIVPYPSRKFGLELNKMGIFEKVNNARVIDVAEDRKQWDDLMFGGTFNWGEYKKDSFDTDKHVNNIETVRVGE